MPRSPLPSRRPPRRAAVTRPAVLPPRRRAGAGCTDRFGELVVVARGLVGNTVECGSGCDDPTLACDCYVCRATRVLCEFEGPGRCVICGCDEEHACAPEGCAWADGSRMLCNRHPPEDLEVARAVIEKEAARA